jgi:hypothetical protein
MKKDYYKILRIHPSASEEEIKEAYRKLAHKYHPDMAGGEAAKFKEINEAYRILSDSKSRAQYDQGFDNQAKGFENEQGLRETDSKKRSHKVVYIVSFIAMFFIVRGAIAYLATPSSNLQNPSSNTGTTEIAPTTNVGAQTQPALGAINGDCTLPSIWGEVQFIYSKCHLNQIAKGTDFSDTYTPAGANGSFDYCNTLIWRKYNTDAGFLYTYEKVQYQHFPMSEAGEYRAPEILYDEMTNSRPCTPSTATNWNGDTDDDISSVAFPSRNILLSNTSPKYWASFFNRNYALYHWGQ